MDKTIWEAGGAEFDVRHLMLSLAWASIPRWCNACQFETLPSLCRERRVSHMSWHALICFIILCGMGDNPQVMMRHLPSAPRSHHLVGAGRDVAHSFAARGFKAA